MKKDRSTYMIIILTTVAFLMLLPVIISFNEFLTTMIMKLGWYKTFQEVGVPYLARMVAVVLNVFGIHSTSVGPNIVLQKGPEQIGFFISWNCLGWQSMILLLITFFVGLQGHYTYISKLEVILIGILGTFLINIFRMALVSIIVYISSQRAASIFHNYGGILLFLGWIFLFWWYTFTFILQKKESADKTEAF